MRTKKLLSIGIVAMLVLTMATFIPTGQSYENNPAPAIWMDPSFTDNLNESNTFTVSIVINVTAASCPSGSGLYMWQYKLYWNTTWLSLVSKAPIIYTGVNDTLLGWDLNYTIPANTVGANFHEYAVSALAPAPPFTGVMWLCNYTFHVEDAPIEPSPAETVPFPFHLEAMADNKLGQILPPDTDWDIGSCRILPVPAPWPKLVVRPKKTQGVCSEKFNITIQIYDLVKEWNLWGWEAQLTYDDAYVCAEASYEGPFLPSFVVQPSANTSYVNILNYTADTILTGGSFNDENHTAPECKGSYGVLSILEFNACVQTIAPEVVETAFVLHDIKLAGVFPNGTVYSIPCLDPEDGKYNVPYKVVGWFLDCTTDPYRKKCDSPTLYFGEGLNGTADSYEPNDLVILFAYLEYNFQPEHDAIVMFEIYGPNRSISIIRTAITNCSGIATIQFTIPNIPEAFGHWVCYQAAQVKIYQKPEDWLFWKVGWIIEITNVEAVPGPGGWVDPEGASKCESVEIIVSYKTISFMPCNVLFTAIIIDELLDPICEVTWWELEVEPTEPVLCSERSDTTVNWCHIPCFAHSGFATVYVNAFTNFPMLCGCPFCPEKTATFYIVASSCPCP